LPPTHLLVSSMAWAGTGYFETLMPSLALMSSSTTLIDVRANIEARPSERRWSVNRRRRRLCWQIGAERRACPAGRKSDNRYAHPLPTPRCFCHGHSPLPYESTGGHFVYLSCPRECTQGRRRYDKAFNPIYLGVGRRTHMPNGRRPGVRGDIAQSGRCPSINTDGWCYLRNA
jgi:hypothetical protein